MNEKIYAIALAGLLHDIGKFMQYANVPLLDESKRLKSSNSIVSQGGYFQNQALLTKAFFEMFAKHRHLGASGEHDSIANLAAYHHNVDSQLKKLIQLADQLSSGGVQTENVEPSNGARMGAIFDFLHLGSKGNSSADYFYMPAPLDGNAKNSFPAHTSKLPQYDDGNLKGYEKLWEGFRKELENNFTKDVGGFAVIMQSLLEKYTWCIPSMTANSPDTSLFDHAKTTAAIAAALYQYHDDKQDIETATFNVNDDTRKFRLLVGDLSGIQKYIFDIKNVGIGGTAKRLRARSFYLSVLAESASHAFLRIFEMPLTNLVISSGGKFYLLLPNCSEAEEKIAGLEKKLSGWLIENLNAEIAINIASVSFSCKELLNFNRILKRANDALQSAKEQAFSSCLIAESEWQEDSFVLSDRVFTDDEHLCPSCRKFPGTRHTEENVVLCTHCFDDVNLGRELAQAAGVQFFKGNRGKYKLFADYSFSIAKSTDEFQRDAYLVQQFNNWEFEHTAVALKPRYFANYVPRFDATLCSHCNKSACTEKENVKSGNPRFFTCLAESSRGRKALGIFKADVDSLGLIFINGFKDDESKNISKITSLSRFLDTFFTGRLDYLLREKFKDIYTVYAGGDDLLMLGPWDQVLRFSKSVRDEFELFTCKNPAFTLSAGVALAKPKLPIYAAVDAAETLLEEAKRDIALDAKEPKNQLATLGDLVKWSDLDGVQQEANRLAIWQGEKKISMGFIRQLLESAAKFRAFKATGETLHLRFVPMLAYVINRNISARETELIIWAQNLTDLKSQKLKHLNYIANYSIHTNRS